MFLGEKRRSVGSCRLLIAAAISAALHLFLIHQSHPRPSSKTSVVVPIEASYIYTKKRGAPVSTPMVRSKEKKAIPVQSEHSASVGKKRGPGRGNKKKGVTLLTPEMKDEMDSLTDTDSEELAVQPEEMHHLFPPSPGTKVHLPQSETGDGYESGSLGKTPYPKNPSSGFIELSPTKNQSSILNDGAQLNSSELHHQETHSPAETRRNLGIPDPGSGGGVGGSFDFYSPPDFKEEIAKAEKIRAKREGDFQYLKNTDLGHGVVCNMEGRWIICDLGDISKCNAKYKDLCRYAREKERKILGEEIVF
jgi:hypothetical protein